MSYDYDGPENQTQRPLGPGAQAALARGRGGNKGSGSGGDHTKEAIESGKYTEVKVRIQKFYAAYPTGALVTEQVKLFREMADGLDRIMVRAAAYRTPDDPHPGRGTSWMLIPGTTPYTKNSEVENCETSAWGRAIAAVGIAIDQNIATVQELQAKGGIEAPSMPTGPAQQLAAAAAEAAGVTPVPANAEGTAPEPGPGAPVPESTAPEPPGKPEKATETAESAADAPEAVKPPKGQGKGKKDAPDTRMPEQVIADNKAAGIVKEPDPTDTVVTDGSPEAEAQVQAEVEAVLTAEGEGLSMEEFSRLAREKYIPNGHIQSVARTMVEAKQLRQVGKLSDLTDQERLTLLLASMAKMEESK